MDGKKIKCLEKEKLSAFIRKFRSKPLIIQKSKIRDLIVKPLQANYSQLRLISLRLIEHSRIITDFLGTGRPHSKQ